MTKKSKSPFEDTKGEGFLAREQGIAAKPYDPTPHELRAVDAYCAREREKPVAPRVKVSKGNAIEKIAPDHPDDAIGHVLLMEALATRDFDFLEGLLAQLANAGTQGQSGLNFMLSVIKGIEPRDQVETLLASQMAVVHMAIMTFARRLAHVANIPQQDSAERAFNKLARTFAAQVEALKRYRTGGMQRVIVEHVTVNSGGQAIVGNVAVPGAGVQPKSKDQPHALSYAPGVAMPSTIKAEREAVPIPSGRRT
jgi:hypothetical protein